MTFEDFDRITERIITQVKTMRDTKGKDYAGGRDRFDNFNRLATKLGIPRIEVWDVYFSKHMDTIESYIRTGKILSEPVEGRIVDAITYLLLLAGMIAEDELKATCNKLGINEDGTPR
jgi:hypothetical protein